MINEAKKITFIYRNVHDRLQESGYENMSMPVIN